MTAHPERPEAVVGPVTIRRALLSMSDKTGLVEFAKGLAVHGVELVSTGGTAKALADAGLAVTPVDEVTGFPEMLDGRVKTLHPAVHGGILHRRDLADHTDAIREHGIGAIDLVCVSLYPFEQTIAKVGVTRAEAVEQIDIGGPAMIRSAAKNADFVAVVTSPSQYAPVLEEMNRAEGAVSATLRRSLATAAFARTAAYDAAIATHLESLEKHDAPTAENPDAERALPETIRVTLRRGDVLRYGENPHQHAAVYHAEAHTRVDAGIVGATQLHGKPLSYNNLNDASAALRLVQTLAKSGHAAACVVKHANPCGAAVAQSVSHAIDRAIAGDPIAAFGGIAAFSVEVDDAAAARVCAEGSFFEVVVAPSFAPDALERLRSRWQNVRLLAVGPVVAPPASLEARTIAGGVLVQTADTAAIDTSAWVHAAGPAPTDHDVDAARALVAVVRALASNAVCVGGVETKGAETSVSLFGAGAGQMDRLASCGLAIEKAGSRAKGSIATSDAFFPFDDGPRVLLDAGVRMLVHPGGSKRDEDTLALCRERGVTCLLTGVRHFRH